MKKVSEEELIDMIIEQWKVIQMVKLSIPKSIMYDKTSALCNTVVQSSSKLLERYLGGLMMKKQQTELDSLNLDDAIAAVKKVVDLHKAIINNNIRKPRYCPYCNKPIIGKITKIYCNENHRRKYLQNKQS